MPSGFDDPDQVVFNDYVFTDVVQAGSTTTYPVLVFAHLAGITPTGSVALDRTPVQVFFDVLAPYWVLPARFVDPDQVMILDYA